MLDVVLEPRGSGVAPQRLAGGAGTAARYLAGRCETSVFGDVGTDRWGDVLIDDLRARGCRVDGIVRSPGATRSRVYAGEGQQRVMLRVEPALSANGDANLAGFDRGGQFDCALTFDFYKRPLPWPRLERAGFRALVTKRPLSAVGRGWDAVFLRHGDFSQGEATETTLKHHALRLTAETNLVRPGGIVVVTGDAVGATMVCDGVTAFTKAPAVHERNTAGAGDVFAAAMVLAIVGGVPPATALTAATAEAAASVAHIVTGVGVANDP